MNNVYDILLNFQEHAFEFFEWNKQDPIEHIKKIPMFFIKTETLYDFYEKDVKVSKEFLKTIAQKTEKYDLEILDYACLFSDGKGTLAIEFNKDGKSMYKSKLLPEDEEELLRYPNKEKQVEIEYKVIKKEPEQFLLTRKERKIKNFLEKEIEKIYQKKEKSKLEYIYLEYFDEYEEDCKSMKEKLFKSMEDTLDKKHFAIYDLLLLLSKKKKV